MRVLLDSGSTSNYINTRECAAHRIKIEAEDQVEGAQDGKWDCGEDRVANLSLYSNVLGIEVKFPPGFSLI